MHSQTTASKLDCAIVETADYVVHLHMLHMNHTFESFSDIWNNSTNIYSNIDVSKIITHYQNSVHYSAEDNQLLVLDMPNISLECPGTEHLYVKNYLFNYECKTALCQSKHVCLDAVQYDFHTQSTTPTNMQCMVDLVKGKQYCTYATIDNLVILILKDKASEKSSYNS